MTGVGLGRLKGQVGIVTGGAAGIGRAVAARLREEEATVVIGDIDAQTGKETARQLGADFFHADISSHSDVQALFSWVSTQKGRLDVLVNNAGGAPEPYFPEAPFEHWSRTVSLNLIGPMLAIQLAIPLMSADGGGTIVNISSIAGLGWGGYDAPEYAAPKAGLVRLTSALTPLEEKAKIRTHCICPDWVDTPSSRRSRQKLSDEELRNLPTILDPSEVAQTVLGLILDGKPNGSIVVLRGGLPPRILPRTEWKSL